MSFVAREHQVPDLCSICVICTLLYKCYCRYGSEQHSALISLPLMETNIVFCLYDYCYNGKWIHLVTSGKNEPVSFLIHPWTNCRGSSILLSRIFVLEATWLSFASLNNIQCVTAVVSCLLFVPIQCHFYRNLFMNFFLASAARCKQTFMDVFLKSKGKWCPTQSDE